MSRPPEGIDPELLEPYDYLSKKGIKKQEEADKLHRHVQDQYGSSPMEFGHRSRNACKNGERWDIDLSVCRHCGRLMSDHSVKTPSPAIKPYADAIMGWFVKNGGVPSYYGGFDGNTAYVRKHLIEDCAVDLSITELPEPREFSEFAGTFTSHNGRVAGVASSITCKCGKIDKVEWAIKQEISLGEMIFQVVQEGITP